MTEPTDAEIIALADETRTAEGGASGYILPISFARAVLAKWGTQPVACEPLTCEWAHNEDDGFWDTECGQSWRFDDGGPKENHMNFCHCCGKPLRIKGGQHGTE